MKIDQVIDMVIGSVIGRTWHNLEGWVLNPTTYHNLKKYNDTKYVCTMFQEAIQSFVRQYNITLLSFVYLDTAFFVCWKLFCYLISQSFDLNV